MSGLKLRGFVDFFTRLKVLVILLAIIAFMAISTNYGLYYRLAYVFALLLVFSFIWTWLNGRWVKVSVERSVNAIGVGGMLEERITVSNPSRFLPVAWIEVRQTSDMPGHQQGMVISLPRASQGTWKLNTRCRQRGKFALGQLSVISSDPMGLFRVSRVLGERSDFLVYPAMADLPSLDMPVSDLPGEAPMRQFTNVVTPSASSVRDYAPGDTFNQIHWKSTARMNKLMVKEFDLEQSTKLWVLLDMQQNVQAGHEEESTEEYAVTAAASIARKYLNAGLAVGLIAHGDQDWLVQPNHGTGQLPLILESLALIRSEGTRSLKEVLNLEDHWFDRYSSICILTPTQDDSWVYSLRGLIQRRVKTSAVLLESQTFGEGDGILDLVGNLAAHRVPNCVVQKGDSITEALDFGPRTGQR